MIDAIKIDLPHLLGFTVEQWFQASPYHNKRLINPAIEKELEKLFDYFPIPGKPRTEDPIITVITKRGGLTPTHTHPEWTMIYYVTVGDPTVAIVVDGEREVPEPGMAFLLWPHTPHSVEKSKSAEVRLSIALRLVESK